MLNMNLELQRMRSLHAEIKRLGNEKKRRSKREKGFKYKNKDNQREKEIKRCEEAIELCKEELEEMKAEKLVELLGLSPDETEIAKNFYYEGLSWKKAFDKSKIGKNKKTYTNADCYKKIIERAITGYIFRDCKEEDKKEEN